MAKFARHLNSFVAGELSPRFYGRTDSQEYGQGAQELLNKIVRAQGGASRRPGSVFVQDGIRDSSQNLTAFDSEVRMIDFRFSRNDAAVVVLSTGSNGLNSYGIAIWLPYTKTWISPTVSLSSGYKAFAGWSSQEELDEIQYSQSGDVLVLVSKKNPPVFISRTDMTTYTLRDIYSLRDTFPVGTASRITYAGSNTAIQEKVSPSAQPSSSQPYYNVPYRTFRSFAFTPSATTGSIVLTITAFGPKWNSKYVGTIMRMTKSGVTGFVRIDSIQDNPNNDKANATVLKTLGGTGTQDSIEEQDFGVDTNSWPRVVAFHDQRLYYGNITDKPNTLWASQAGDYTELMIVRPADDANFSALSNDRPFSFALAGNQVDDICWFLPSKSSLFIGTTGGEWLGLPSSDNILGPLNPNFQPQTTYGSKFMQAMNVNGSIIFVDRTGQHMREFTYNRDVDNYRAVDLLYFADHMVRKGVDIYDPYEFPEIMYTAWQDGQNTVVYIVDSNGMLHALSKERDYGTLAWSTIQLGGAYDEDDRPPKVKALCCIPNDTANDDDVYVIVERYLNGTTKRYLEKIGMEFIGPSLDESSTDIQRQPVFADCAQQIFNLTGPKFFARYASSIDADYWNTSGTGTGTGSPTASNGLVLTGGGLKYVSYDPANAMLVQTGTIVIEYVPNYSGTPAAQRHLLAISKTNADDKNLISIYHSTDGHLYAVLKDSAGSTIVSISSSTYMSGGFSPVAGESYLITYSFNATTGKHRLFINTKLVALHGANPTGTRDSNIGRFVVGTSYNAGHNSDFTIRRLAIATSDLPTGIVTPDTSLSYGPGIYWPAFAVDKYVIGLMHHYGAGEIVTAGQYRGSLDLRTVNLAEAFEGNGIAGLQYSSRIKLMDLEAGSILGSAQGAMKRVHEITARFERSVGAKYGPDEDHLDEINFTPVNHDSNTPIPLYTGDHTLKYRPGYSRNLTMVIQQDKPYPCTLTSIIARGMTSDA